MKRIHKYFNINNPLPFNEKNKFLKTLFFDIETTGLSNKNSQLYIIGLGHFINENTFSFTQYFISSLNEEKKLVQTVNELSKNFIYIVHFNGDAFDLPYFSNVCKNYNIENNLNNLFSLDLYKLLRNFKKFLNIESLKQKSIETLLDLKRNDTYNGYELINIYKSYIQNNNDILLEKLLLHNEEDIIGLVHISSCLHLKFFFTSDFKLVENINKNDFLYLKLSSKYKIPFKISYEDTYLYFNSYNNIIELKLKIIKTDLKYYLEDYKNYYYLSFEDTCIHKDLANFINKSAKVKASRENAFIKKNDIFLNFYGKNELKKFKEYYLSKKEFILFSDFNESLVPKLLQGIFKEIGIKTINLK